MKTFRLKLLLTIITTAFLLLPSLASAAGLWLYEMGIPDNFMAAAGRAALASDASTAGTNPAGMIRLERSELFIGFAPVLMSMPNLTSPRPPTTVAMGAGLAASHQSAAWPMSIKYPRLECRD